MPAKKMLPSLLLGFFTIIFFFQGTLADNCAKRKYGQRNIVCVCNSTYCDTLKYNAETDLLSGLAVKYTSTESGLRFHKTIERFQILDNFIPDLIPPTKLHVNASKKCQVILGFGATLTDSAGYNIASLSKEAQDQLLRSYFSEDGIEYVLIKVPMAGTDHSNRTYTYADVPNDKELRNFTLVEEDYEYKIPFLTKIKKMSKRDIKLHSSVCTAPAWMKNTGLIFKQRSSLKHEYYQLWADYFVRFLQAYEKAGVTFWAMSPQNKPSLGTKWSMQPIPTAMGWSNKDQKVWIRDYLVPTLGRNGYSYIKILGLDDDSSSLMKWLAEVLNDKTVRDNISGIAIHWYTDYGKDFPDVLRKTHQKFPEKFILYNDASLGPTMHPPSSLGSWQSGEHYACHIIKVLKNWAAGWMEGNMVLDVHGGPRFMGTANDAAIIVNKTANEFYKQPTYYILGHFSKFIPADSVRIDLDIQYSSKELDGVAFLTPEDTVVTIVYNKGYQDEEVEIIDPLFGVLRFNVPTKSISTVIYSIKNITTTATSTTTSTSAETIAIENIGLSGITKESTTISNRTNLMQEIINMAKNKTDLKTQSNITITTAKEEPEKNNSSSTPSTHFCEWNLYTLLISAFVNFYIIYQMDIL